MESYQGGGDDTALNGICLYCSDGKTICSGSNGWGSWTRSGTCNEGFLGANFKVEDQQGGGDDTSANELLLECGTGLSNTHAGGGGWGRWLGYKRCANNNQRICGIQTRIERFQGDGDDTALNGVDLKCCEKTYYI